MQYIKQFNKITFLILFIFFVIVVVLTTAFTYLRYEPDFQGDITDRTNEISTINELNVSLGDYVFLMSPTTDPSKNIKLSDGNSESYLIVTDINQNIKQIASIGENFQEINYYDSKVHLSNLDKKQYYFEKNSPLIEENKTLKPPFITIGGGGYLEISSDSQFLVFDNEPHFSKNNFLYYIVDFTQVYQEVDQPIW